MKEFFYTLAFVALTIVFALLIAVCDVLFDLLILVEVIGGTVAGVFDNKKLAKKHKHTCKRLIYKQGKIHNKITCAIIELFHELGE